MPARFTPTEVRALHNKKIFYIKTSATEKTDALLASARDVIKSEIKKQKIYFPKYVDAVNGKIYRGENYLGLPYLILDYPKHFSNDSVFAFRTMFWWGNFFSCTLHLQGKALDERRNHLINNWKTLRKKNIYMCANNTPWQYNYSKENYKLIDKFSESEIKLLFMTKEFIKLSRKTEIKNYKKLDKFCRESFTQLFTASSL